MITDDGEQWWVEPSKRLFARTLHRDNDLPALIGADGSMEWYQHGKLHRENGPAFIGPEGDQAWFYNGEPHRNDGPAKIWADGTEEWWSYGKQLESGWIELKKAELARRAASNVR